MSNFTKWHLLLEFFRIFSAFNGYTHRYIHNSREIWYSFSRTPLRNFLWCYYRWLITSLALQKCKTGNAIFFKLFWYKVFVHWELKLLNFLVDSVLNVLWSDFKLNCSLKKNHLLRISSTYSNIWDMNGYFVVGSLFACLFFFRTHSRKHRRANGSFRCIVASEHFVRGLSANFTLEIKKKPWSK